MSDVLRVKRVVSCGLDLNPNWIIVELKVAIQAHGACFRPYNARRRRHTFWGGREVVGDVFIQAKLPQLRSH